MEFPRLVYKDRGPHQRKGGGYSFTAANDEDEHAALLAAGWSASLDEAVKPPAPVPAAPALADNAEPTRDEIVQKLEQLGAPFDRRLGDKKLLSLLEDALKAKG